MECSEIFYNIVISLIIGLITGFISGLISGYIVYKITKKREEKYEAYLFCRNFLFSAMEKCEMYVPMAILEYIAIINPDVNSRWNQAMQNILHYMNPFGHEDKEMSEEENIFFENIMDALEELNKSWKKDKSLRK